MTALFSLQNGARLQTSTWLSMRSFCESILFVHLKVLRWVGICAWWEQLEWSDLTRSSLKY